MNEEEKKVVELLQHCQNTYIEDTLVTRLQLTTEEAKILLNLIDKQQKEIEELKYHIYYKTCKWCGDEFKTKSHNAKYCTKCRETKKKRNKNF